MANEPDDVLYDKAANIAETHLNAALEEGGDLEYLVAVMMIEASINAAVELTGKEDIIPLLKDLTRQIELDLDDED
jgi:hypothetical protein